MQMFHSLFLASSAAIFLPSLVGALSQQVIPCQCSFSSADPPDCVAYGQLGDGNLIPWSIASQECLDLYKIKDEAIDPGMLESIFVFVCLFPLKNKWQMAILGKKGRRAQERENLKNKQNY